jgi:hypothetical protein
MNLHSNKTLVAGAVMLLVGLGAGWALSQWPLRPARPNARCCTGTTR